VAVDVSTALPGGDPGRFIRNQPDEALVALVMQGSEAAFEVIYDRHHRGLLAFCRHMLRSREEAEDALQHTFAAAYRVLTSRGERPNALKPWLYAIARNRCLTVIRARQTRDAATEAEADASAEGTVVEGLADAVQRRSDLRELVDDIHRLPDDQRAALVLFEMGDHSHAEIADVLDVDRTKVKALVFQAREGLMRARTARDTPCAEIRRHLSSRTRALPRRGVIKGHLDTCPSCAAYDLEVRRQRTALAMVLPVVPSLELKSSVLGPLLGTGATVAAGGAAVIGTGAAGTAAIGTGALGSGAVGATAGGLAAAGAGAGATGLTGGAAIGGIGALAANAVVAKVVTVVAVAGAAAGAGHAIKAHDHAPNQQAANATNTAVVTTSKPVSPVTGPDPVAAPDTTTTTTFVPPRVVHQTPTVVHHPPAASGTSTTAAATPASATKPATTAPATQDPADQSAPATGGTAADGTGAGGSAPADPAPSTDPGASGSAPSTPPDTSAPPADEPVVGASELPPDEPAADPASDPAATPVTCPPGTVPVATNPTAIPPPAPAQTDPAAPPPVPMVTLADGTAVPIPDGCGFLPVVSETTAAADPAVAAAAVAAATAAATAAAAAATAAAETPPAP
jgi:RNA polymerase sigma factor (sigma-70 family)